MKIYNRKNTYIHLTKRDAYMGHTKRDLLFYFNNQGIYSPGLERLPKRSLYAKFMEYVNTHFRVTTGVHSDHRPEAIKHSGAAVSEPCQELPSPGQEIAFSTGAQG